MGGACGKADVVVRKDDDLYDEPEDMQPNPKSRNTKSFRVKNSEKAVILARMTSVADVNFGFTNEQVQEFRNAFNHFDADGSGDLSLPEICAVIQSQGVQLTEDELNAILDDIDLDGNGTVDFQEFLFAMSKTESHRKNVAFMQDTVQKFITLQRQTLPIFLPLPSNDPRFEASEAQRQAYVQNIIAETEGDAQERALKKSASRSAQHQSRTRMHMSKKKSRPVTVGLKQDLKKLVAQNAQTAEPSLGVVSLEAALANTPATERNMLGMFTYSAFEDYHVQIYWPTVQVLVRDMEQTFCVAISREVSGGNVSVVNENFDGIAVLHAMPSQSTATHTLYFGTATVPKKCNQVFLASKAVVGEQLKFDVYCHFDTESAVEYYSRFTNADQAKEAMVRAYADGDMKEAVTQAKVALACLPLPDYEILLMLSHAYEQLAQPSMTAAALDSIIQATDPKPAVEILEEAYELKVRSLLTRGFYDECLATCTAARALFPANDAMAQCEAKAREELVKDTSPNRWNEVDDYALLCPPRFCNDIKSLSKYLGKPFDKDVDKVRAVYRWICENIAYDGEGLRYGSYLDCDMTPEGVLDSAKAVCEGFCNLFVALCEAVGCEAAKVVGWARSGLVDAESLRVPNHMWNAVLLDGSWHLLDITWSAGTLNPDFTFKKEFNPFFFLTQAPQFLNSHFPEDNKWMLVSAPVTKEQFATSLYFSSHMYVHGIKPITHTDSVIRVKCGDVIHIQFHQAEGKERIYLFPQAKMWSSLQSVVWDTHATFNSSDRKHTIVVDTVGSDPIVGGLTVFFSTEEVGTYSSLLQYKIIVE